MALFESRLRARPTGEGESQELGGIVDKTDVSGSDGMAVPSVQLLELDDIADTLVRLINTL